MRLQQRRFGALGRDVRAFIGQQHRYEHSVRVARMADTMAQAHGLDPARARLAGMLHDLARLYSAERLLAECARLRVPVDAYASEHPVVLHAPLSARLAAEHFGVDDAAVHSAIEKHTLGAGEMSALDCVLYLADSLEPGRDFAERESLASLAYESLHEAMRATLASSLRYLAQKRLPIAPQTAAALKSFGLRADSVEVGTGGHS